MFRFLRETVFIFLLSILPLSASYTGTDSNRVFDDRVKTILLYRDGWNLSQPVFELGSDQKLKLEFDLLGTEIENLYYTFVHCDKDWTPSGLFSTDFSDGFHENQIEEYAMSFNTTVKYVHYSLVFPNENIKLTASGNYLIAVHRPGEADRPLFSARFMVAETQANVRASVRRADMSAWRDTHQQIEISVGLPRMRITDPRSEVFTSVLQNGRWDNARTDLVADFISPTELRYTSLGTQNLFFGGNEFRQFDIRSFRYQSEFVRDITYDGRYYNVNLTEADNREFKPYFFRNDFNGKYVVGVQEGINPATDADYAWVHFTLPAPLRVEGGSVHIAGGFTGWTPSSDNLMRYNPDKGQYEGSVLVKQGWYDYEFLFIPDNQGENERRWFEGSHYEAENEYLVLVYYRERNSRYDRIIGYYYIRNQAG
ncbi:MAG: DUF5103 domain-containing protein [Bacteroidales bacterium]|nr:DUF5103 domain-containing protein [Bacteroidales bacterium]